MTLFIKLENGSPVGHAVAEENFRALFPNVSFPNYFTADAVEPLGYGVFDFSERPTPPKHHAAIEAVPIKNAYGVWVQTWAIVQKDEQGKSNEDAEKSAQIRQDRNFRLAACDWTQLSDAPLSVEERAAYAAYRQALRDVSSQPGFPWTVEWPAL